MRWASNNSYSGRNLDSEWVSRNSYQPSNIRVTLGILQLHALRFPCHIHPCRTLVSFLNPNCQISTPEINPVLCCKMSTHNYLVANSSLFKVKVTLRLTVSQSISLGVEPHLGLMAIYLLLFDSCGLVFLGRPLWRDDVSVFCIRCWPSSA
jgi:hypothetical protein